MPQNPQNSQNAQRRPVVPAEIPDREPGGVCRSYAAGHRVHWIHWKQALRDPAALVPVHVEVAADGHLRLIGVGTGAAGEHSAPGARQDDGPVAYVRWNHDPPAVREALAGSGGAAAWDRRWHLLRVHVHREDVGRATRLVNLVEPRYAAPCRWHA